MIGDGILVAAGRDRHHAAQRLGRRDVDSLVPDAAARDDAQIRPCLQQSVRHGGDADDPALHAVEQAQHLVGRQVGIRRTRRRPAVMTP